MWRMFRIWCSTFEIWYHENPGSSEHRSIAPTQGSTIASHFVTYSSTCDRLYGTPGDTGDASAQWTPVLHLDSHQSLTKVTQALAKRGEAGLFRIVQMQRCVWAEMEKGQLRLHGSHALSPDNLRKI